MRKGLFICTFVWAVVALAACATKPPISEASAGAAQTGGGAGEAESPTPEAAVDLASSQLEVSQILGEPSEKEPSEKDPAPEPPQEIEEIDYASVRPYEVGQIMIVMYHGLVETDDQEHSYQRTIKHFKEDLQTFYDRGFRLVPMKDWLDNNIRVPAGYAPLILTFDDGIPTAFSLEKKDGGLAPVENCAVGIMTKFNDEHPGFGNTAMFFINQNPFQGEGTLAERFKYLLDHGYELGNHTMNHKQMSKMEAGEIQAELGGIDKLIRDNAPGYEPYAISYPYGERPLKDLHGYVLDGSWEGGGYHYRIAVREGQSGPPSAVNRVGFDPINVPRVRASDDQDTDLGWTLRQYENNPQLRYISDGNPGRVAVPVEYAENVDMGSLNGKELYLYNENGGRVVE